MSDKSQWVARKSKTNRKTYYFNLKSGQSSWVKPEGKIITDDITSNLLKSSTPNNKVSNKPRSEPVAKYDTKNVPKRNVCRKTYEDRKPPNDILRGSSNSHPVVNNDTNVCTRSNVNKNNQHVDTISKSADKSAKALHAVNTKLSKNIKKNKAKTKNNKLNLAERRMNNIRSIISTDSVNPDVKMTCTKNIPKGSNLNTYKIPVVANTSEKMNVAESMDWETIVGEVIQARVLNQRLDSNITFETIKNTYRDTYDASKASVNVVIDTNIFLSHLETVEKLIDITTEDYQIVVVVPWRVFCELDSMKKVSRKDSSNVSIDHLARRAMSFLHENLPTNDRLRGQSLKEASNHIFTCTTPDDEILNCCLQFSNSEKPVVLLSNDKNLCNKGFINNIEAYTHEKFETNFYDKYVNKMKKSLQTKANNDPVINSNTMMNDVKKNMNNTNKTSTTSENIEKLLKGFFSTVLENEMKSRYNELWKQIVFIKPPWTLGTILRCISKHWMAVFSEVLPKEAQNSVRELQYFYPIRRKVGEMSTDDLKSIVSAGCDLIKHLQDKSEYKTGAADCCRALREISNNAPGNAETKEMTSVECDSSQIIDSSDVAIQNNNTDEDVSNTLIFIWNGFSVYCSQLANNLGVTHCLDQTNKLGTPFHELLAQANSVANQINALIEAISRVLVSYPIETHSPEYKILEANRASDAFYGIIYDTVVGMGQIGLNYEKEILIDYCCRKRDILEDGFNKFSMLRKLLEDCSVKYSNM